MAVFLAVPALTSAISAISAGANRLADAKPELKQKTRWMVVNIDNHTQFTVQITDDTFKLGRFCDAPGNITKFSQSAFSVCNRNYLPTGVAGIVRFELDIPEEEKIHISIAFSNPLFGGHKIRAEFTDDVEGVYGRLDKGSAEGKEIELGERKTKDGKTVNVKFRVASVPGDNARVTITQIEDPVKPKSKENTEEKPKEKREEKPQRMAVDRVPTALEFPPAAMSSQDFVDTKETQLVKLEPRQVELEEKHLVTLINLLAEKVAMDWKGIGLQLGFLEGQLNIIERMPDLRPDGAPAFFQEMLSRWLKWYPPSHPAPTIEALANAIRPKDGKVASTLKDDFLKSK